MIFNFITLSLNLEKETLFAREYIVELVMSRYSTLTELLENFKGWWLEVLGNRGIVIPNFC